MLESVLIVQSSRYRIPTGSLTSVFLASECKRATLKSLSTGRCVVVSRYDDDRDSAVICGELLLQFKAGHPGQIQIENQTIRRAFATRSHTASLLWSFLLSRSHLQSRPNAFQ